MEVGTTVLAVGAEEATDDAAAPDGEATPEGDEPDG